LSREVRPAARFSIIIERVEERWLQKV